MRSPGQTGRPCKSGPDCTAGDHGRLTAPWSQAMGLAAAARRRRGANKRGLSLYEGQTSLCFSGGPGHGEQTVPVMAVPAAGQT